MVAVQYSLIGLINPQYRCDYTGEPTQVMSCCNLLVPVCQLSSNSWSVRMSFSQVQRVFIVKHYLASCSYLTCQNEFRDIFPNSPVPDKSTVFHLVNCFCDTESMLDRNCSGRLVLSDDTEHSGHIQHLI
jgi:hypothetical protein